MKNLIFLFIVFLFSCTPVKYVYVDPKDSVIRKQRIIRTDVYLQTPFYLTSPYYGYPYMIPQGTIRIPYQFTSPRRIKH